MQQSKSFFLWIFVLLAALDIAKHSLILASGLEQPWGDSLAYWNLGSDIARGDVWMLQSAIGYRTLGYPWLVGICQLLGQYNALILLVILQQTVAMATNGFIGYCVTRLTRSHLAGLIAYAIAILNTSRAIHANWILTETFSAFLILAACYCIWNAWGSTISRHIVEVSVLVGVGILVRPSLLIFVPILFAFAWKAQVGKVRAFLIVVAILGMMLAPCYLRNYYLFGRMQLVTFQGRELWTATFSPWPGAGLDVPDDGLGAELKSKLKGDPQVDMRRNWSVSSSLASRGMRDANIDQLMASVAWQAIRREPGRAMIRFLVRTATFWYCWNWPPDATPPSHESVMGKQAGYQGSAWCREVASHLRWTPEWNPWMTWLFSLATWLCIGRLVIWRQTRGTGAILLYVLASTTLLTAFLEIPNYRYRMPLEPLMIVAIACGIWSFLPSNRGIERCDAKV